MLSSAMSSLLLPYVLLTFAVADNSFIYPPADASDTLYIPSGTPITISWNTTYESINLRVFQQYPDGSFNFNTILSNVSSTPGEGSYAWVADILSGSKESEIMHFEVTLASNGQSIDPFNSGDFYINQGSAISTSVAPTTQVASSTSAASPTSSNLSSTPKTSSSVAAQTSVASASSVSSSPPSSPALALGLGLGLGIPLILLIGGLLALVLRRRRKAGSLSKEKDKTVAATSTVYYEGTPQKSQYYEVDGHQTLYEAPSEAAHEAAVPNMRYEMDAGRDAH